MGIVVRIDNVSHVIDHSHDGIIVSPGFVTNVALTREFKSTLPKPYSNCELENSKDDIQSKSDLFNLIWHSSYDYSQNFCLQQCLQKLLVSECKCRSASSPSVINASICGTTKEIECDFGVYNKFYVKNDYVKNVCLPQCPLECNTTRIAYTSSFHELLGEAYVNMIRNNYKLSSDFVTRSINAETVKKSIVRLRIFYESLAYTISEEFPSCDLVALIANIGGNLGLFLGVSLLSLSEIVTTLIELYFFRKNFQGKIYHKN